MCCDDVRGGGAEREQWCPLHSLPDFSHPLCYPQSNWAPLFPSGWACARSRPLWVSPTTSPVRLGFSPAAAPIPTGILDQRFEALFPHAGALGCVVCFIPRHSSRFICARMWGHGVLPAALPAPYLPPTLCQSRSRQGNASPLRPGCPSPSLLLVWMNAYFLFPCCRSSLPFDFLSVLVV